MKRHSVLSVVLATVVAGMMMMASCGGSARGGGDSTPTPTPTPTPAPTVTIAVSPTSIVAGDSATVTWATTNATACTASGAWSGTQTCSGSASVSPTAPGTYTYALAVVGPGGNATASATLTVRGPGVAAVSPAEVLLLGGFTVQQFVVTLTGDLGHAVSVYVGWPFDVPLPGTHIVPVVPVPVAGTDYYSVSVLLTLSGPNSASGPVSFTATDAAGNVSNAGYTKLVPQQDTLLINQNNGRLYQLEGVDGDITGTTGGGFLHILNSDGTEFSPPVIVGQTRLIAIDDVGSDGKSAGSGTIFIYPASTGAGLIGMWDANGIPQWGKGMILIGDTDTAPATSMTAGGGIVCSAIRALDAISCNIMPQSAPYPLTLPQGSAPQSVTMWWDPRGNQYLLVFCAGDGTVRKISLADITKFSPASVVKSLTLTGLRKMSELTQPLSGGWPFQIFLSGTLSGEAVLLASADRKLAVINPDTMTLIGNLVSLDATLDPMMMALEPSSGQAIISSSASSLDAGAHLTAVDLTSGNVMLEADVPMIDTGLAVSPDDKVWGAVLGKFEQEHLAAITVPHGITAEWRLPPVVLF